MGNKLTRAEYKRIHKKRPPIGIVPFFIWFEQILEQRMKDIDDATKRFIKAKETPPEDWEHEKSILKYRLPVQSSCAFCGAKSFTDYFSLGEKVNEWLKGMRIKPLKKKVEKEEMRPVDYPCELIIVKPLAEYIMEKLREISIEIWKLPPVIPPFSFEEFIHIRMHEGVYVIKIPKFPDAISPCDIEVFDMGSKGEGTNMVFSVKLNEDEPIKLSE
jgi:hypothetical protein